jgi:catechol 2,3-dioxygenase-like lactoylglutathione lyase family enzyme
MPRIERLGHVGIYCSDLARQTDFYSRVLGLTITDRDDSRGLVFLSARPDEEDHELLLAAGRNVGRDAQVIQQVSFRCPSLADVRDFHDRLRAESTEIDVVVSHGVAVGVYFFDPEGNRVEVYYATGIDAPQPHVIGVDIAQDDESIMAGVHRGVAEHPGTAYIDETVFAGQHIGEPPRLQPPFPDGCSPYRPGRRFLSAQPHWRGPCRSLLRFSRPLPLSARSP